MEVSTPISREVLGRCRHLFTILYIYKVISYICILYILHCSCSISIYILYGVVMRFMVSTFSRPLY